MTIENRPPRDSLQRSCDTPLQPENGARYLFERRDVSEDSRWARYGVTVFTADQKLVSSVVLRDSGAAEFESSDTDSDEGQTFPENLFVMRERLAKATARDATARHSRGLPPLATHAF